MMDGRKCHTVAHLGWDHVWNLGGQGVADCSGSCQQCALAAVVVVGQPLLVGNGVGVDT